MIIKQLNWKYQLICLGLIMSLFLASCLKMGGDMEHQYKTYEDFKSDSSYIAKYLPTTSTDIRHYAVLDFDTNYHFLEANVKLENLEEFVKSMDNFDSPHNYSEVPYTDQKFDSLFYKRPNWWNQESLSAFKENHLSIYTDEQNYGRGCWLFYDSDKKLIRIFTWSQQWTSLRDITSAFQLSHSAKQ